MKNCAGERRNGKTEANGIEVPAASLNPKYSFGCIFYNTFQCTWQSIEKPNSINMLQIMEAILPSSSSDSIMGRRSIL